MQSNCKNKCRYIYIYIKCQHAEFLFIIPHLLDNLDIYFANYINFLFFIILQSYILHIEKQKHQSD